MSTPPYYQDDGVTLHHGDARAVLAEMPSESVHCIVTSPPYFGLRDYGVPGQMGIEATPADYVAALVATMAEVRRVLRKDGTCWLNLGDSYASGSGSRNVGFNERTGNAHGAQKQERGSQGRPPAVGLPRKSLLMMPARVAIALQDDGWILRNDIIWSKPNTMPESVTDRLSTRHEHLLLLTRSQRYHFDLDGIREQAHTVRPDALSWDRREQSIPGQKPQHRPGRPQRARAEQLAADAGLTTEHLAAIRAVGVTDTGKATQTQTGTGRSRPEMLALAAEAKEALGGYYREFLTPAGKNPGDVWTIPTVPFTGAHFAAFPPEIPRRCILAGSPDGGVVLDPFHGSGTTGMVAQQLGRRYIGIDLSSDYLDLSLRTRLAAAALPFNLGDAS